MSCNRCPHHVRQGLPGDDGTSIVFKDLCGLRVKQAQDPETMKIKGRGRGRPAASADPKRPRLPKGASLECTKVPFDADFDYFYCDVYQDTFKTTGMKNGVLPTKDFQYSERLSGNPITDMEFL